MSSKTFYLETFGCQMNVHDSEKVVGTLLAQGYSQVETPEDAGLVLYNTCSIRDKAEQKVFNRLQQFKRDAARARSSACWAAWRSRKARRSSSARRTSAWWPARPATRSCGEMLVQLEAGNRRVTGLSLDTDETFDTPFTRRDNPHRAYITIIEGCDKSCAYCVVPFTRGPERSRTSESVMAEARRLAEYGYTEIQLLGQNVNSYRDPSPAGWDFATLLARVGRDSRHPPRALHHFAPARFRQGHRRRHGRQSGVCAITCTCRCSRAPAEVLAAMQRLYTRDEYMQRIEWIKNAPPQVSRITTDIIVGFPGETESDFEETLELLDEVQYDSLFSFKYSPRPNTAALAHGRPDSGGGEDTPPRDRAGEAARHPDPPQCRTDRRGGRGPGGRPPRSAGPVDRPHVAEPHAEFHACRTPDGASLVGKYMHVRVTRSGPNSLAGESVTWRMWCNEAWRVLWKSK